MRPVRPALVRGCFCLLIAHAATSTAAAAVNAPLILEVWINDANTSVVASIVNREGAWWASRSDLIDAGIKVTAELPVDHGFVPLAKLNGITAEIDRAEQRLVITARTDCLAPRIIDLRPLSAGAEPASTTGLVASYAVTGIIGDFSDTADTSGVNAALAATFFAPLGTITTTMFSQTLDGASQSVRLDTTAEWDEPGLLRRWLVGDAISGGLSWSRAVRFGGLQLSTDFTLQPGLTTFPLPAFLGQTAVPGSVDVFVNSTRVFEGDVSPGPFEVRDLPVVTGGGQATVVVRDILGQETTQTVSFYATNALLEKGLSAYDLDIGSLRELYGERSFDY